MSDREIEETGTRGGDEDFDLLAASLRADLADLHALVPVLGAKLAGALPGRVQLHHSGLFGGGSMDALAADLGAWRFTLHIEHGRPVAGRMHVVRGIVLKTEEMPLDVWVNALSQALANLAASSMLERAAILRLFS